jgi:hypothetical protein
LVAPDLLRSSRAWPQDVWDHTVDELRSRGLIAPDDVRLSEAGQMYRSQLETQTDELTMPAYGRIGQTGAKRVLELAPPIVAAVTSTVGRMSREAVSRMTSDDG